MADDSMSEDQWLYGDSTNDENKPGEDTGGGGDTVGGEQATSAHLNSDTKAANENIGKSETDLPETNKNDTDQDGIEAGEITKEQDELENGSDKVADPKKRGGDDDEEEEDEEDDDDDDSDDNVHVTIGDIKTTVGVTGGGSGSGSASQQYNIKRGVLPAAADKMKQQPGKFSIEEFESIGTINGLPAHEFSIDALEEKPWRKPGADITDYFNYGFNEETWRAYCERQKTMRMHESGVGLGGLGVSSRGGAGVVGGGGGVGGGGSLGVSALPVVNDNSKYSGVNSTVLVGGVGGGSGGLGGVRKAGPPPGPRRSGVIDVIGGSGVASRRATDSPPKENAIQVMTADKRDYGRKNFDMSIPPPGFEASQPPIPPVVPSYPPHPYNQDFYNPEVDTYYQAYEPTQDLQWNNQSWSRRRSHVDSKSPSQLSSHHLHPGYITSYSYRSKSSVDYRSPGSSIPKDSGLPDGVNMKQEPLEKSVRAERERERERHKERHRHRSRSRSGERSERRSRKHKSRSRSPGSHRSHKKKKSKKSERTKDNSD